jgi:hypothetical protein
MKASKFFLICFTISLTAMWVLAIMGKTNLTICMGVSAIIFAMGYDKAKFMGD